ncbi:unnamed protein product [Meloidogyne enterolobii]|uniref:Uncharacterized protein n=1 Tax=Meloidogyne enterolobii TaxID=390850 RepID=A0ACB0Z701_MELEN
MLNTSSTTTANASLPTMQGPTEKLKYPLVCVTPFGTISITMAHNVNIEISLDRSIRVVCWNKFAVFFKFVDVLKFALTDLKYS